MLTGDCEVSVVSVLLLADVTRLRRCNRFHSKWIFVESCSEEGENDQYYLLIAAFPFSQSGQNSRTFPRYF